MAEVWRNRVVLSVVFQVEGISQRIRAALEKETQPMRFLMPFLTGGELRK
jgi:hypothetical protein